MSELEEDMRLRVSVFLPEAMARALESYEAFLAHQHLSEPKDFKAHHDACKTAIGHLDLLIKLAEKVGIFKGDGSDEDADVFADAVHDAIKEVKHHRQKRGQSHGKTS